MNWLEQLLAGFGSQRPTPIINNESMPYPSRPMGGPVPPQMPQMGVPGTAPYAGPQSWIGRNFGITTQNENARMAEDEQRLAEQWKARQPPPMMGNRDEFNQGFNMPSPNDFHAIGAEADDLRQLPPGWKPNQIGPAARAAMGRIPGIGPFMRDETTNVAGEVPRLRVNGPNVTPPNVGSPPPMMGVAPETYNTASLIGELPGVAKPATPEAGPDWRERNKGWLEDLGQGLQGLGAGIASTPPGSSPLTYLSQGAAAGARQMDMYGDRKLDRRLKEAQVGKVESDADARKQARELAKSLPADHPARPYFALGLIEKGLEQITPDYNKLIVNGPDGKPKLNETLMNAKAYIEAAGKVTWGVIGHDNGGKPIHGWVSPVGAMPGAPGTSPAIPGATPPQSAMPGAVPAQGPPALPGTSPGTPAPGNAIPPPPPGADPYKWAEDQTKLRIQREQGDAARKTTAPLVIQDLDRALGAIKKQTFISPVTGTGGAILRQLPGSAADNLDKLLDSVRSTTGFDALTKMRQQSPTGGALGSITERELAMLQATVGSLSTSQTREQLEDNIRRVKNQYLDIIHGPGYGPPREKLQFEQKAIEKTDKPEGPASKVVQGPNGKQVMARRAPDGKYYIPDPERPGKYLMVQ